MSQDNEKVILMVPEISEIPPTPTFGPSTGIKTGREIPITPRAIFDYATEFTGYELDTIEVNIKGAAQSEGITKLFVGVSGEAGVTLKFKKA